MPPTNKREPVVLMSTVANPPPFTGMVPTSAVPIEWLRKYSSPKPVFRPPLPRVPEKQEGEETK